MLKISDNFKHSNIFLRNIGQFWSKIPIVSQLGQGGVPMSAINQILVDSVKAETVKNDTWKPLFDEIETLAEPFVTRLGSSIKTDQYYA